MRRSQLIAAIWAVVIFGMGFALGMVSHRFYNAKTVNASEDWRQIYVREMQARLKLNQSQVDRLNDILDDTHAKYKTMRDRHRSEMIQIKQGQIAEVKSILTGQQVPEYEKIIAEREAKAKIQEERANQLEQERARLRHERLQNQNQAPATTGK